MKFKQNPRWFFAFSTFLLSSLTCNGMEDHISVSPQPLTHDLMKAYEVQTHDIPKFTYKPNANIDEAKETTFSPGARKSNGEPVSFNFGGHTYNLARYSLISGNFNDERKTLSDFLLERDLSISPEKFEIYFGKTEEKINNFYFSYETYKAMQEPLNPRNLDYYISLMLEKIS